MGSTRAKGRVTVRGSCGAGHVTETRSDPGRVTWEGTCTADGCELPVKARRVPRERPEVTAPAATTPPPEDADKPKLRKVNYGATPPKPRGQKRADSADGAGGQQPPAGGQQQPTGQPPAAVQAADGPAGQPTTGGSSERPQRPGLRSRLAARRRERQAGGSSAAFRLPWED